MPKKPPDQVWYYIDHEGESRYYGDIRWVVRRLKNDRRMWERFGDLDWCQKPQCWQMTPKGWMPIDLDLI